ncbi:protein ZBED8-like [Ctenocephalides felis]|uniref:protein ZBED8-like n=1 Tax=Ctenocephalides felis TaxID=7515 RepID=UPI000E6E3C45|nr:protein ZBED8-like [Ctenocephalides felis]
MTLRHSCRSVIPKVGARMKKISLSNNTVQRRIDEMAQDVEDSLCGYLKTSRFSIQLDESTLPENEALLLAYVRFIREEKMCQELLFAKSLKTDTKGETIFFALDEFFKEKGIPLRNILSVATDGAPAMVGRYKGFFAFLKKKVPNAFAVHCVIHRQHLVAKNLSERLHNSLQYVIRATNLIKSRAKNDRLFKQLCIDNDEEYNRLLLHTEVRWLSKGACLDRFYKLFNSVLEFLKDNNEDLRSKLIHYKSDIAYLTDLFKKFNECNIQLQGDEINLIKTKSIIPAFITKLFIFKQNFGRGELGQFPNLSEAEKKDSDIQSYCEHLNALHSDFSKRFEDIMEMNIPDWIFDPFTSGITEDSPELQEELMEIMTNEELKFKFKSGYQQFWLQKEIPTAYPQVWSVIEKFLIAFPSSYLVECGFSGATNLLTNTRNRLQIVDRGDLRLLLTKIEPRIAKLVAAHQIHPSN